ncbi:MAG: type II toxin-antitoxin system RelE/ParE family toxin [Vulcanibacillus sp.]
MANIRWSNQAVKDLEAIINYISQDSEDYAKIFVKKIINIIETIPELPYSGREVPEYKNELIREKFFKNYRIIYRIRDDVIEIIRIFHFSRLFNKNLD